jgi:hypothetical protein
MLSHQPDVSRQLYREHVQRLADDAQYPLQSVELPSPRPATAMLSRLAGVAHAALAVSQRHLSTRT